MARTRKTPPVEEFNDSESEASVSEGPSEDVQQDEEGEANGISEEPPTSIDPYAVLEVPTDASEDAIKRSYRKLALQHHPDKAASDKKDDAKEAFQRLAFAYAILSDPTRRSRYDATGSTSDSILDVEDDDFDWLAFYRSQFENVITEERINAFKDEYKGGEEEKADVLEAYKKGKGSMDMVYAMVMLSDVLDDDERFRAIIEEAIETGEVEAYGKYTNETEKSKQARLRRARGEEKEAQIEKQRLAKERKEKGGKSDKGGKKAAGKENGDLGDLAALIQNKQKERGGFMEQLEAKYGGGKRKRGGMEEPPEEAFAENRAKGRKGKA